MTNAGRPLLSAVRRVAPIAVMVAGVVVWVLLRPLALGGPTGLVAVSGASMQPGLASGDFVVTFARRSYRVGDVVAFKVPRGEPGGGGLVIHRIVGGSAATGYRTKGDNRDELDIWRPRSDDIVGRQLFHIPHVARLIPLLREPAMIALLAALLTFLTVDSSTLRRRPKRRLA